MSYLPDELWMIIIKYQTQMRDYNPTIFSKQYQKVLKKYNKNWEIKSQKPSFGI
jgi:hypothetical protein